ncbi:MAG: carboxymuconolactone decarboxylase family protein [Burkholderiales bacterium]|nr:MAG: carboxymuconolactone decarboxylase family protein [Burkholderiales bacterium]
MKPLQTELDAIREHFMQTLGNVPEPIRAMADYAPEALVGYARTRGYIMRRPPQGALDVRTKELIYVLLDVVSGNLDGAKNHLGAAMREGLTVAQLAEACMQVMAVCGITTWGQTGWKLCDYAAELERAGVAGHGVEAEGAGRGATGAKARGSKSGGAKAGGSMTGGARAGGSKPGSAKAGSAKAGGAKAGGAEMTRARPVGRKR